MTDQKILFICSVDNFQQYTRRATIEAIGLLNRNTTVACIRSFWKKKTVGMTSDAVKLIYFYYFFPRNLLLKSTLLNHLNYYLNKFLNKGFEHPFNLVCFTFPTQSHLLPFFKKQKTVFILSDPYHLMKQNKEEEAAIIVAVDFIFATAKALASSYITKYFGKVNAKIVYWPNCVDLSIWDRTKFDRSVEQASFEKRPVKIGFAGNFMKITDFALLDEITAKLPDAKFILAGKVEPDLAKSDSDLLEKVFSKKNVDYKGLIPYQDLQAEISSWDIGIMIDKINEIASYHHHNKFYQYLALGLPVVYHANHNDYDAPTDIAASSKDSGTFLTNLAQITEALKLGKSYDIPSLSYVRQQTNEIRAKSFLKNINSSNPLSLEKPSKISSNGN